jgi:putative PIN family toxin of toxin-antitoxin system
MRVCLDTNLLIGLLLNTDPVSSPFRIVQAALQGKFDLLLSETTFEELLSATESKAYLAKRISRDDVLELIGFLRANSTVIPEISTDIPPISRDADDDYLVTHAVLEEADFLVSGDKDLLALGSIMSVRIVSPADFVRYLYTIEK